MTTLHPAIQTLDTGTALSREMELLEAVSRDPSQRFLWLWQGTRSLVVPRKLAVHPDFQATANALAAKGWPAHTRATGGDATPQGPGIINVTHVYSLPAREAFHIDTEYDRICTPIEAALGAGATRGWQPGAFCDGAHNVQFNAKKFAGTAMRFRPSRADRSRVTVMAHALMLVEPPSASTIAAINDLLGRLGQGRVIKPEAHTGLPPNLTLDSFVNRLIAAFEALPISPLLTLITPS